MSDVGVIGLGAMGANLARNLARRGHRVVGCDQDPERAARLASDHPEAKLAPAADIPALVAALRRPRAVLVLVPAGDPVDDVLGALGPLLAPDDVAVDGGNSRFDDTDHRIRAAQAKGWSLLGMGVSGGARGALHGPSLMPGGEPRAWEQLRPLLESIAATSDVGPCVAWCGRGAAGHFVKMVHNGIEYAEMQHLAESLLLLRRGLGMPDDRLADVYTEWNQGPLESFLVEITAAILRVPDPQRPESLLLDAVLDRAGQKGTGRWTAQAALELGVAVPSIVAAVDARVLSSDTDLRRRAEQALRVGRVPPLEGLAAEDIRDALLAARIAAHAQGFTLLAAASRAHGFRTNLAEVARIWKAGCIIRSRLLDDVHRALAERPAAPLALAPALGAELQARVPAWRRAVSAALRAGIPVPGLAAGLTWFDTLSTARGSAGLIQAQRDCFGGHGYQRIEAPERTVHTQWRADVPGAAEG